MVWLWMDYWQATAQKVIKLVSARLLLPLPKQRMLDHRFQGRPAVQLSQKEI
jgi:hypothetical protein